MSVKSNTPHQLKINTPKKNRGIVFKTAMAGFLLGSGAFVSGVAWNMTDEYPKQELVNECNDKSLTAEFSSGLIEGKKDNPVLQNVDVVKLTAEGKQDREVTYKEISQCDAAHKSKVDYFANHPSKPYIVGGLATAMVFGAAANTSTYQSPRSIKRAGVRELAR